MAILPKPECVTQRPGDALQALLRLKDAGRNLIIPDWPAGYLVMVVQVVLRREKYYH